MPREVTGKENTTWNCVEAYAGLSTGRDENGGDNNPAAAQDEARDVVCTPGGGAQTVRLRLNGGWEDALSDEELLRQIEAAGNGNS